MSLLIRLSLLFGMSGDKLFSLLCEARGDFDLDDDLMRFYTRS